MVISHEILQSILNRYEFSEPLVSHDIYLQYEDAHMTKLIVGVALADNRRLVVKLTHDQRDFVGQGIITERQSAFSELLRTHEIRTPQRYKSGGSYCTLTTVDGIPYHTTLEDWCGYELTEIQVDVAYRIGALMARMHTVALDSGFCIGRRTIFDGVGENDVDVYPDFCRICEDPRLDSTLVESIKELYEQKRQRARALWLSLPKAATQGDFSINNLTLGVDGELTVFDYNIAGDEVLVSDMVLEGLFVAYQMDLPHDAPLAYRERIFPAFYEGYLSVRPLTEMECTVAWELYTMYHSLWGSTVDALEAYMSAGQVNEANRLLSDILAHLQEQDDGRFRTR